MVAIAKYTLASLLVAYAVAHPLAVGQRDVAIAIDSRSLVSTLTGTVSSVAVTLGDLLTDLDNLNTPAAADDITTLIKGLGVTVADLIQDLNLVPGLGTALQAILDVTGLQTVLNTLDTVLEGLVDVLLKNPVTVGVTDALKVLLAGLDTLVTTLETDLGLTTVVASLKSLIDKIQAIVDGTLGGVGL